MYHFFTVLYLCNVCKLFGQSTESNESNPAAALDPLVPCKVHRVNWSLTLAIQSKFYLLGAFPPDCICSRDLCVPLACLAINNQPTTGCLRGVLGYSPNIDNTGRLYTEFVIQVQYAQLIDLSEFTPAVSRNIRLQQLSLASKLPQIRQPNH